MQDYKSKKYIQMWYKNNSSVGIRRKFGDGTQIWSFGRGTGLSKESLTGFGCMVLKKLDSGSKETAVKAWVDKAVKA